MATDPHRRNLIAISSTLSIFFLGNGKIEKITTLFGAVELKNPNVLIYSACLMLIYFCWQYWLNSKENWNLFGQKWRHKVRRDKEFQKIADTYLRDANYTEDEINDLLIELINSENHGVTISGPIWRRTFKVTRRDKTTEIIKQKQKDHSLDVISTKHKLKLIIFETDFSNYILPYFFVIFSLICGLYYKINNLA